MRFEIYVPEYETEIIKKVIELKGKRKLSSHIVELMKKDTECLTKEQIIELIKQYSHSNNSSASELEDNINSILGSL